MKKIDRYINNQVLLAMAVVLFVLAGLDFVFTLVDEVGETEGTYGFMDAIRYVMFVFPRHIYELLPMTALIGALIGLGILASSNELVVLQASGVKVMRIVWAVMKPAILVMAFGLFLGEYIAPRLELQGELDRALARGEQVALSRNGYWQRDSNEFMHFNAIDPEGVLHGVSIYRFDGQQLAGITTAETALYDDSQEGGYWVLQNGTELDFAGTGISLEGDSFAFLEKSWPVDLTPDLLKVLIIDPDKMSISDLFQYAPRHRYRPSRSCLTTAALVIVAVAFIFGPLRSATMGSKVFTAICFGILFYLMQNLLSTVSLVYQLNPLIAVTVPIVFCLMIGLTLLKRVV